MFRERAYIKSRNVLHTPTTSTQASLTRLL